MQPLHATVALLALALPLAGSQVCAQEQTKTAEQAEAAKQTPAVLKLQEFNFSYRSSVAYFSCSELEHRVRVILRALGARDDVEVVASGCNAIELQTDEPEDPWSRSSDPWPTSSDPWHSSSDPWDTSSSRAHRDSMREQSVRLRVRAMMPTEVTPEVLAEMDKDKSRRELISRVTGNAAKLDDPILFPARRELVELSHRTIRLGPEDCELLEQLSASSFRKLDLRIVHKNMRCDRREVSRFAPQLTVEALMPVMPRSPQVAPGAGEADPASGDPAASETTSAEPVPATPPK